MVLSIGFASSFILVFFLVACAQVPKAESITSFTTDGCSLFPNRSLAAKGDWCDCFVTHDCAYYRSGTSGERLAADLAAQSSGVLGVESTRKNWRHAYYTQII